MLWQQRKPLRHLISPNIIISFHSLSCETLHILIGLPCARVVQSGLQITAKVKAKTAYILEKVLHIINLSNDTPELAESPVRRAFGFADMYRDFSKVSDQHYLENHLSKLESQASMIVVKIRKAFESGNQELWISRPERDVLRKLLFIMKYRGKGFHKRFVGDETDSYVEDDKEKFLKYMHEKGFQRPLDVWFFSIKTILELKMDLQGEWRKILVNRMYPDDAMGFIMHAVMMFFALCTPSSTDTSSSLPKTATTSMKGQTPSS